MQLGTSSLTTELPVNHSLLSIALDFQRGYLPGQSHLVAHSLVKTLPLKHAYAGFSHIEPTGVLGGVVELQLSKQPSGLLWCKGLVQRGRVVGVEVVLNHSDKLSMWVSFIHQPFDEVSIILAGATLGNLDVPVACLRLHQHKQISRAVAFVLVILAGSFTFGGRQGWSDLLVQCNSLFFSSRQTVGRAGS